MSLDSPASSHAPAPAPGASRAPAGTIRAVGVSPNTNAPIAKPPSRWGVLEHVHFRRVVAAQFVSNIGTWSEFFAIQMYLAQLTGRLDDQGVLGACQQVPIAVFGLLGGLAADRYNRRTLVIVTQILAGLVAAGVAVVSMVHFASDRTAVYWLCGLGVVNGVVMAFNFPAWQVLTPRLVPRDQLVRAITLNGIQFNMARVVGPAVAGLAIARFGGTPLLWFNAMSFLLMAGVVLTTPDAPAPPRSTDSIRNQIQEAFSFLIHQRGPRAVLAAQVLLSLMAAPLVRLLSNFVIDVYKVQGREASQKGGTLLAIQGVGAVIGGLALRYLPKWYPRHHFIPLAVTGLGVSICIFGLTTNFVSGYIAIGVCGWFWMWAFNQSWATLQVLTPDRLRGRALSLATVGAFGGTALGVLIAGLLGEHAKRAGWLDVQHATQASVLILSVPLALAGLWMMMHRVPEIDGHAPSPPGSRASRNLYHAITAREHRPQTTTPVGGPIEPV